MTAGGVAAPQARMRSAEPEKARAREVVCAEEACGTAVLIGLLETGRIGREEYAALVRLITGWRWLSDLHQPGKSGRCRGCPRSWRGRPVWPCVVVRAVTAVFTD